MEYGAQNGYQGASSLTPGQTAPSAANNVAPPVVTVPEDTQMRHVSAEPLPTTYGMSAPRKPTQIERAISRK